MLEEEKNEEVRSVKQVYLTRGITIDEVKAVLHYPHLTDRDRAFFRAIYETFYRPEELLSCHIEDYDKDTGEIPTRFTKRKYNPRSNRTYVEEPKQMKVSPTTMKLLRSVIRNRKKGRIFMASKRRFQQVITEVADKLGIQKVTHITATGRKYHLVSLKALREAGERHHDHNGGDRELSAKAAQHSLRVKEKYYKKLDWVEMHQSMKKHHPAFRGEV